MIPAPMGVASGFFFLSLPVIRAGKVDEIPSAHRRLEQGQLLEDGVGQDSLKVKVGLKLLPYGLPYAGADGALPAG